MRVACSNDAMLVGQNDVRRDSDQFDPSPWPNGCSEPTLMILIPSRSTAHGRWTGPLKTRLMPSWARALVGDQVRAIAVDGPVTEGRHRGFVDLTNDLCGRFARLLPIEDAINISRRRADTGRRGQVRIRRS